MLQDQKPGTLEDSPAQLPCNTQASGNSFASAGAAVPCYEAGDLARRRGSKAWGYHLSSPPFCCAAAHRLNVHIQGTPSAVLVGIVARITVPAAGHITSAAPLAFQQQSIALLLSSAQNQCFQSMTVVEVNTTCTILVSNTASCMA